MIIKLEHLFHNIVKTTTEIGLPVLHNIDPFKWTVRHRNWPSYA